MKAVAYYRTSSASGVGEDKDSEKRQRGAVTKFADNNNYEIVKEFYDAAVRGVDEVWKRPNFSKMISYMECEGIKVIILENASRFARDLEIQLGGLRGLKKIGISLIASDAPLHFVEDTPMSKAIRSMMGMMAQFEKDMFVERSRLARERIRQEKGRCEGRKPAPEEAIRIARELRGRGMSLRAISAELHKAGHGVVKTGGVYHASSVACMVRGI